MLLAIAKPLHDQCPTVTMAFAPWLMDEHNDFISWLRGEFTANTIVDLLLVHLHVISDPTSSSSTSAV
jgi:hypothetical protein